jgi:DNA-binding transcriptional LysR family regulator
MKIDDMDAFVAVIRCQSTNLAAEALQLTQPAITRRVQNFEEDLGATLSTATPSRSNPPPWACGSTSSARRSCAR